MAIHLLRDYPTQNLTTGTRSWIFSYLLAIFLRRVLNYSHVGSTNFPINDIGSLLIATGNTTPTTAPTFPPGNKVGINIGSQKEFHVTIPISIRTVSNIDIGRILVLRSLAHPTFNSGLFVIIGLDVLANAYIIDYRTLGDKPPVEAADSIEWYLYEKDINCPTQGAPNTLKTSSEYRGDGNSTTPRIILQSPHATGWQVRICNESTGDLAANSTNPTGNCPQTSAAVGFDGNSAGDFSVNGQHSHAPQFYNSSHPSYLGGAPGFGDNANTGYQFRVTMVGDEQGIVMFCRRVGAAAAYNYPGQTITCFGLAENEVSPLPVNNAARLFTIGSGFSGNDGFGNRGLNLGSLQVGVVAVGSDTTFGNAQGMSVATFGVPIMCAPSMWAYISGGGQGTSPVWQSSATDCPFTSSTELLPIDLMQGTLSTWNTYAIAGGVQVYPFAPRNIGTMPHVRFGRTNFGDFSPSTDSARSYQHLKRGIYIPWNGPNIIP